MARIRSIKPEFWTSGQVLECSTNARLLFIGLWNFCDDAGRHPYREKQIKAQVFPSDPFSSQDILGMLQELSTNGLIERYVVDEEEYLQVCGWCHQRIDKPQDPRYPAPLQDRSKNIPRTIPPDGIGRDGIGKDRNGLERIGKEEEKSKESARKRATNGDGSHVWESYAEAYASRYGTKPVRNAKVNGQITQLIARVGADDAPAIAAFFVRSNNAYYVKRGHAIGALLSDAEKLATEWRTGKQGTESEAREQDGKQKRGQMWKELIDEARAKDAKPN